MVPTRRLRIGRWTLGVGRWALGVGRWAFPTPSPHDCRLLHPRTCCLIRAENDAMSAQHPAESPAPHAPDAAEWQAPPAPGTSWTAPSSEEVAALFPAYEI